MQITYICTDFPPIRNAGSVRNKFFIDKFIENGAKVHIFTSVNDQKYDITKIRSNVPYKKDHNLIRLIKEVIYSIELFFKILIRGKKSLYVITPPPFFVLFFSVLALKIRGFDYIVDVRDLYPEVYFVKGIIKRDSFLGKFLLSLESYSYKNAYKIFTVTEGIADYIESTYSIAATVLRNGYDSNIFFPRLAETSSFTVGFHGNMGKFQNIKLLDAVIKRINKSDLSIKFKIIGDGSNASCLDLKSYKNTVYIKSLSYKEIPNNISDLNIGLSFRTDDFISITSFPVKIFEYIGMEIPVISTPITEAGSLLEENQLGFQFSNNQLDEIVEKILEVKKTSSTSSSFENKYQFSRQIQFDVLHKSITGFFN